MDSDRPPLTEAEYAVWAEAKARQMADQFTEMLPQEARDAGIRFEFAATEEAPVTVPVDRDQLAAMTSAERLRTLAAYEIPPELREAWQAIADDTYDRMTASACNDADTCVMDKSCPFVADCAAAEARCGS